MPASNKNTSTSILRDYMKVCCLFSLESLHRGDSNEYLFSQSVLEFKSPKQKYMVEVMAQTTKAYLIRFVFPRMVLMRKEYR